MFCLIFSKINQCLDREIIKKTKATWKRVKIKKKDLQKERLERADQE